MHCVNYVKAQLFLNGRYNEMRVCGKYNKNYIIKINIQFLTRTTLRTSIIKKKKKIHFLLVLTNFKR